MLSDRRPGFTLVELLFVIAILIVFAALVAPVVGSARKAAHRVTCLNNERALLMATNQYVHNDPDGRLPFPNYHGAVTRVGTNWDTPAFPGWLYTWPNNGNTPDDMKTGTLWPFVPHEQTYHCPLQDPQAAFVNQPTLNITSYVVNFAVYASGQKNPPTFALTDYRKPAETVFLIECAPTGQDVGTGGFNSSPPLGYFNDGTNSPRENSISDRHGLGASIGFLDGHVEFWDFSTYRLQLSQGPSPLWCNPYSANGQ